jgi:hypothetical protein
MQSVAIDTCTPKSHFVRLTKLRIYFTSIYSMIPYYPQVLGPGLQVITVLYLNNKGEHTT